jgi:molybdenum cofactor cytidylyltransferase
MNASPYTAIILAAGFSSRMEHFKPLLKIGGRTAVDHLISLYRKKGLEVILVTGWQKEQLTAGIDSRNISIVENPDFATGMFSSIKAGLKRAVAAGCGAVFIHPVDIPLVRPYTIRRLLEAAEKNPGRIIYPLCAGERGHPVLLPAEIIPSIPDRQGEGGLKAVLENQVEPAVDVTVPDDYIHLDMDRPADYRLLLERYQAYEIPSPTECEIICDINNVAHDRRRHCLRVADIALELSRALVEKGSTIDLALVRAGAVLHDLAKGQKDHAGRGGSILGEMGFAKTGEIVAAHSDLPHGISESSLEAKIVFLADKLVAGETPVSVEERYALALSRFGSDSSIKNDILQRKVVALGVKQQFELALGGPLEKVIRNG